MVMEMKMGMEMVAEMERGWGKQIPNPWPDIRYHKYAMA